MEKSASTPFPPAPDRLIRVKELRQMLGGASSSTIYRWIAKGILPEPRRISARFVAWNLSDVTAFLNSRKEKESSDD